MNNVYEELDEAKAEIQKLKAELRGKTSSLKNLKRSHDAQVNQIQEAISKVEKLEQELLQKAYEIIHAEQIYDYHNLNLNIKESNIKYLSVANDKHRKECGERFEKCEDQNRELVLVLEEVYDRVENQERQETECLSISNQKEQHQINDQLQQFKPSMKECELEKSTFLDEISLLKSKLDFHVKISQDLQHQLQMCKQLLAHEDSQRKSLEVEVSDLKLQFESVNSEYQKSKLQLDCFNSQQNIEIEDLKQALKTQEENYKESKYFNEKLEQENQQLRKSFRELNESREARASYSLSMLRSNLRGLEQTHKECVSIFKARQVEWSFQVEELTKTIDNYRSELETKAATIQELEMELECSHSFTKEMILLNEEMSVMLLVLKEGLSEHNVLQHLPHKGILEESIECRTKIDLKDQHKEIYGALDKPNIELDDRTCGINAMEFQLQMWKSFVENLENDLEENRVMRKEVENSLLAQVYFSESLKKEKDSLEYKLQEEENIIDYLQLHVFVLKQVLRVKGKNMEKYELMQHVTLLEREFISSLIPFNSQLAEKHIEIIQVQEVCDKITEAEALAAIEIEEKKLMIEELEDDIIDMEHKLKLQEENWSQLKQLALDIEMEIDAKQLKIKELTDQMENKLRGSDVLLQKIKMENRSLLENDARLLPERENLLGFVLGLGNKMSDCPTVDTNLVDLLRSLVQSFEKDCVGGMNFKNDDELFVQENMIIHSPKGLNKPENFSDIRSPFKELNHKLQ